jgi:hypothetical protein
MMNCTNHQPQQQTYNSFSSSSFNDDMEVSRNL